VPYKVVLGQAHNTFQNTRHSCEKELDDEKAIFKYSWNKDGHSCKIMMAVDDALELKRKAREKVQQLMNENGWTDAQVREAAGQALAEIGF